jgi:hypothetical protein
VGEVVPKQIELFYYSFNQYPIDFLSSYFNGFSPLFFYNSSNPISIQSWVWLTEKPSRRKDGRKEGFLVVVWDEDIFTIRGPQCPMWCNAMQEQIEIEPHSHSFSFFGFGRCKEIFEME